ncbi:SBBP repeat-containing protein [Fluviicola sp.]|uniref:DUF7948 domain-containing protein n=1 Tax=Fluviicola sp. TaxID=1917219 RepID=UPI003D28D1C9
MFIPFQRIALYKTLLLCSISNVFGQVSKEQAIESISTNKVVFVKNQGQVLDQYNHSREDVLYSGNMSNVVFHLKNNGISYQFIQADFNQNRSDIIPKNGHSTNPKMAVYRLDMNWLNVNPNATVTPLSPENNPSDFTNKVAEGATYGELYYTGIYSGINLHYYQSEGHLKYDFEVEPFADYRQIVFEIAGAEGIQLQKDGSVLIKTPFGSIVEQAPLVYQQNEVLPSKWKLEGNRLSFELEGYNPNYPCLIDPIVREWGTYYGGNGWDASSEVLVDANNNVLLCGRTNSSSTLTIATTGAHQDSIAGDFDAFIAKFDEHGTRLWGTYFGGSGVEYGNDITIDLDGNIYLVGSASNNDGLLLTTPACHQSIYGGGQYDVILAKFTSSGQLIWSTLYGGDGWDAGFSCQTDNDGNVYITGQSNSTNLSTPGGFQQSFDGGIADAFIAKFSSSGTLLWGTYYGGADYDMSRSCDIDLNGNIYIAGHSSSDGSEIATPASHQAIRGGLADAFLAKFSPTGNRIWGTFYGGSGSEDGGYGFEGYSCVCDALGNVYLGGVTTSSETNVIATSNGHQPIFGGIQDAFLVKFSANGARQWGTYYGGSGVSQGYSCCIDQNQNVYMAGMASSDDAGAIATSGAFKGICEAYDNFLVSFNSNGQRLWGTFYGGQSYENTGYCATDNLGNIYLSGSTDIYSSQFQIVSPNGHQTLCNQFQDSYLAKLSVTGSASINEIQPLDFTIYPNPVKNILQIENTSNREASSLKIYNLSGELVLKSDLGLESSTINISSLNNGLYILSFEENNQCIGIQKIVKE